MVSELRKNDNVEDVISSPSLSQLYSKYHYTPPSPHTSNDIKGFANLEVEWSKVLPEVKKVLEEIITMQKLDIIPVIKEVKIENLTFKLRYIETESSQAIDLYIHKDGKSIAEMFCRSQRIHMIAEKKVFWELQHRFVSESYRGTNMGSNLLSVVEHGIAYLAKRDKKTQVITIPARQLGVINFALKNGYTLKSSTDKRNYELILEGDRSKILVATIPELANKGPLPGYIFLIPNLQKFAREKKLGDLSSEQIWEADIRRLFGDKAKLQDYVEEALTVALVKEKKWQTQ